MEGARSRHSCRLLLRGEEGAWKVQTDLGKRGLSLPSLGLTPACVSVTGDTAVLHTRFSGKRCWDPWLLRHFVSSDGVLPVLGLRLLLICDMEAEAQA